MTTLSRKKTRAVATVVYVHFPLSTIHSFSLAPLTALAGAVNNRYPRGRDSWYQRH